MVKWLTILVLVAATLWGGWWFVGASAVDRGARTAIDSARAQGWGIEYGDLTVAGFPNRFDVTLDAPRVMSPDGVMRWSAPFVQVLALSYRLNHVIAVAPREMTIEVPGETIDITSTDLRASAVVTPSRQPDLRRATITASDLTIRATDLGATFATAVLAARQNGSDAIYDVAIALTGVSASDGLRAKLDPTGTLPEVIDTLDIDTMVVLSNPIGITRDPVLSELTIRRATVNWGDARVILSGDLTVAADGTPDGDLTLRARGWDDLLAFVVAQEWLTAAQASLIGSGLSGLEDAEGFAEIPVSLSGGQIIVMGLPVGPAPRL